MIYFQENTHKPKKASQQHPKQLIHSTQKAYQSTQKQSQKHPNAHPKEYKIVKKHPPASQQAL
jgi:hypothetical protein